MSKEKRSRMGPESDEYNRLKGKIVRIWPQGEQGVWIGRLVWVDVYTLGVAFDYNDPSNVSIVYKAGIRIERYDPVVSVIAEKRDNDNGVEKP
jgi:hypothetical protein